MEGLEEVAGIMFGAFEHQVLEQMREPPLVALLVLGTDVIPEVHRHDRQVPGTADDDVEAVGKGGLGETEVRQAKGGDHEFKRKRAGNQDGSWSQSYDTRSSS